MFEFNCVFNFCNFLWVKFSFYIKFRLINIAVVFVEFFVNLVVIGIYLLIVILIFLYRVNIFGNFLFIREVVW